jgi:tRNA(Arg) A34 adenosine deaminase TadA
VTEFLWTGASPTWRQAFELAWEGYQAGSPPVGAVVMGPDGKIVACGRSRRAESTAPSNHLAGSRLAHAEINALAQLPPDQYAGCHLFVTLEPCLLCWAAISISHVPMVSFAGEDPMWRFLGDLPTSHPELGARNYSLHGPLAGPLGAWAALLPLLERLVRDPIGARVDHFRNAVPALVDLGERLVADGRAGQFGDMTLDEALASIWDDLHAVASAPTALLSLPSDFDCS